MSFDIVDEAIIDASPAVVWQALVAELNGAAAWWVPHNTYEAGATPPEVVGGETKVTVHTKGVGRGGPKLRFTSRTTAIEPERHWVNEYVDGVFSGTSEFTLSPVDGGERTRLAMRFQASPNGLLKVLARVKDIGAQHSSATQEAFANLNALVAGRARREVA
jgi:uncharacterized protein YndB with AHSA1/START domain